MRYPAIFSALFFPVLLFGEDEHFRDDFYENNTYKIEVSEQEPQCGSDMESLNKAKTVLFKKFRECSKFSTTNTIHVLGFKVYEKEVPNENRPVCWEDWEKQSHNLAYCFAEKDPNGVLFSKHESWLMLYKNAVVTRDPSSIELLLLSIQQNDSVQARLKDKHVLADESDYEERSIAQDISYETVENLVAYLNVSREDKDVLLLLFKYLKARYDQQYSFMLHHEKTGANFGIGYEWIADDKVDFLKKYPASRYEKFLNTEITDTFMTEKQKRKKKKKEEKLQQELKSKRKWMHASFGTQFGTTFLESSFDDWVQIPFNVNFVIEFQLSRMLILGMPMIGFGSRHARVNDSAETSGETSFGLTSLGWAAIFGFAPINRNRWSVDLLFGCYSLTLYPTANDKDSRKSDITTLLGIQTDYMIPITEVSDVFLRLQWLFSPELEVKVADPDNYRRGSMNSVSLGVGIHFGKPKPRHLILPKEQ